MKFTLIHVNNLPPVNLPILPESNFYLLWKAEGMKKDDAENFMRMQEAIAVALQDGHITVKETVSVVNSAFKMPDEQRLKVEMFGQQLEISLADNKINFFEAMTLGMMMARIFVPGM